MWYFAAMLLCLCMAACARRRAVFAGGALLFARREDDSDMKIAGMEQKPAEDEAARAAERLAQHKKSGADKKARALGEALAVRVMAEDVGALCSGDTAARAILQCRLLLSCAVSWQLDRLLDKVLAGVAREAFTGTLERDYANFYTQMTTSGALSFYTLCLRDAGEPSERIGRTFARLSGREDDEAAARGGAALYRSFTAAVEQAIGACGLPG